jgi:hypothetical protein
VRQEVGPPWVLWVRWVGALGGRLVQYAGGRHWWVCVVCSHWQTPSFGTVRGGGGVLWWGPPLVLVLSLSALVRWWWRL